MRKSISRISALSASILLLTGCNTGFSSMGKLIIGIGGLICAFFVFQLINKLTGGRKEDAVWSIVAGLATMIGFVVLGIMIPDTAATIVSIVTIVIAVIAAIVYFRAKSKS